MDKGNVLIAIVVIFIILCGSVFMNLAALTGETGELYYSPDVSLRELAQKNGIAPRELKFKLEHDGVEVGHGMMRRPVREIGLNEGEIRAVLLHALERGKPGLVVLEFGLWAVLCAAVVLVILRRKKSTRLRKFVMIGSVVVFGVLLGATPNPMESVVKTFKLLRGIQGGALVVIVSLVMFSLLSIWGAKLVCSWGCQLGALQEVLFNIPLFKKKYRFQVPFGISLVVRVVVFGLFLVLLFRGGERVKDFVLYHHVNYFKIFRFGELAKVAFYTLPIMIISSVFVFRPFCQFVCPFGLWALVLQNLAINKIRIDKSKCTECKRCVKSCPTKAMREIYSNKRRFFLADCWSCGKCIEECPTDSVGYGLSGESGKESAVESGNDNC
jgi:ferredoxin